MNSKVRDLGEAEELTQIFCSNTGGRLTAWNKDEQYDYEVDEDAGKNKLDFKTLADVKELV